MLCVLLNKSIVYYGPRYIIYIYFIHNFVIFLLPSLLECAPISRNSTRDITILVPDPSASRVQLSLQQLLGATDRKLNVTLLTLYL
jgi:hypothetical protein